MIIPFLLTDDNIHVIAGTLFESKSIIHIPFCTEELKSSNIRTLKIYLKESSMITNLDEFKSTIIKLGYDVPEIFLYGYIDLYKYKEDVIINVGILYNDILNTNIHIIKYINGVNEETFDKITQLKELNTKGFIREFTIENILK